jgi:hypothetical protein
MLTNQETAMMTKPTFKIVTRLNDDGGARGRRSRVFFFVDNETVMENLIGRHNRPVAAWKAMIPEVLEQLGLDVNNKSRWSTKCGCGMCPCSPGFYLSKPVPALGSPRPLDIYVTIS